MLDKLRQRLIRRLEELMGPRDDIQTSAHKLRTQGNALISAGDLAGAEKLFREVLSIDSEDTPGIVCLGFVLKEQQRLSEARVVLKRAAKESNQNPAAFEAYYLLGQISEQQGDLADAEICFSQTLRLKPDFSRACEDLIRLINAPERQAEVKELLLRCVQLSPQSADYRMLLAKHCTDHFDFQGAVDNMMAATELGVNEVQVNLLLGAGLCRLGRESEALKFFQLVEAEDPSFLSEINYHRGYFHARVADITSALSFLQKSIDHKFEYLPAHSLMLLILSYTDGKAEFSYEFAAKQFAKAARQSHSAVISPVSRPKHDGSKPLRLGFMCGEFRLHPVYFFLIDVLKCFDLSKFNLIAFSNNPMDDDATTLLKRQFQEWHELKGLTNEQTASLIQSNEIDVLIDLSGHTGDNRLAVFSMRPAPVQVTWLGYFASTGIEEIDYIFVDPVSVPEGSQEWFSEKVYRLPDTRLCMAVPTPSIEILVTPPPCLHKGHVTFGSFQQSVKITKKVIFLWAQIMNSVPRSRLRIQNDTIHLEKIRERISIDMDQAGIDLSRVDFVKAVSVEEYLQAHADVDILLDTFPYTGGTTTALALWMGVPTVSLVGDTMLARQGAMMLNCVGLSNWLASSQNEYVARSIEFAQDVEYLRQLRLTLREVALKSPLFDSQRFASNFQEALSFIYQEKTSVP